jgi:serine/threonine-protein kinase
MQLPASIGKYELLEFLGGGMSQVYRGRDTVIDRPVVVKILTLEACADPEAKARFLQEARVAGNIQHENIVSVFDFGEHDGRPYIVMEYLKGEDLREALRNGRTGSLFERLKIALQIAEALNYVHGRNIIHRDIKPENIHIDPTGRVKLMDFGIAKTAELSLTRTGMAMGTPYYMSPEQVAGRATSTLVDVYAYGMLLFELLTGVRGITGDTMETVFYQILNVPLDVTLMENAGVPPAIRELVMRCTEKTPDARPKNFAAVIEVLKISLGGTETSRTQAVPQAPAATLPPRRPAPAARSIVKLSIVVYASVLVVTAMAVVAWLWLRPPPQEHGMVYIPAGTFLSGPDKKPATLKAFYIDEVEVTNAEFGEFCRQMGCTAPPGPRPVPVVNVNITLARAFAKWKNKRLPTALEWERAARGLNGNVYPWGNEEDPSRANVLNNPTLPSPHGLMPVRSFSPSPVYQMVGNAWEMVEGEVRPSPQAVANFANLNPPPTADDRWVSIRGGAYNTPLTPGLVYDSASIPEGYSSSAIGFRCAKDP